MLVGIFDAIVQVAAVAVFQVDGCFRAAGVGAVDEAGDVFNDVRVSESAQDAHFEASSVVVDVGVYVALLDVFLTGTFASDDEDTTVETSFSADVLGILVREFVADIVGCYGSLWRRHDE